jgi:hypothetical protein
VPRGRPVRHRYRGYLTENPLHCRFADIGANKGESGVVALRTFQFDRAGELVELCRQRLLQQQDTLLLVRISRRQALQLGNQFRNSDNRGVVRLHVVGDVGQQKTALSTLGILDGVLDRVRSREDIVVLADQDPPVLKAIGTQGEIGEGRQQQQARQHAEQHDAQSGGSQGKRISHGRPLRAGCVAPTVLPIH